MSKNRKNWNGIQKRKCKNPGCKKRVRSHFDLMICDKCVKLENERKKKEKEKKSRLFRMSQKKAS